MKHRMVSEHTVLAGLIIEFGEDHSATEVDKERLNTVPGGGWKRFVENLATNPSVIVVLLGAILALGAVWLGLHELSKSTPPDEAPSSRSVTFVFALSTSPGGIAKSDNEPNYVEALGMMGISLGVLTACLTFASTLYLSLWQSLTDSMATLVERIDATNRAFPFPPLDNLCVELKDEAILVVTGFVGAIARLRLLFSIALVAIPLLWIGLLYVVVFEDPATSHKWLIVAGLPVGLVALIYWWLIFSVQILGPIPEKVLIQRAVDYLLFDKRFKHASVGDGLVKLAQSRKRHFARERKPPDPGIRNVEASRKVAGIILTARREYSTVPAGHGNQEPAAEESQ